MHETFDALHSRTIVSACAGAATVHGEGHCCAGGEGERGEACGSAAEVTSHDFPGVGGTGRGCRMVLGAEAPGRGLGQGALPRIVLSHLPGEHRRCNSTARAQEGRTASAERARRLERWLSDLVGSAVGPARSPGRVAQLAAPQVRGALVLDVGEVAPQEVREPLGCRRAPACGRPCATPGASRTSTSTTSGRTVRFHSPTFTDVEDDPRPERVVVLGVRVVGQRREVHLRIAEHHLVIGGEEVCRGGGWAAPAHLGGVEPVREAVDLDLLEVVADLGQGRLGVG